MNQAEEEKNPSSVTVEQAGEAPDSVSCPFCNEDDFDLIGLKSHLSYGHCDAFNDTELAARPLW